MGGNIFQQGANALSTPHMPRPVYLHMLRKVHTILDGLRGNERIETHKTPIPAPGKAVFGDVDVIIYKTVATEDLKNGKPDFGPFLMQLQSAFGAVSKARTSEPHTASYAIPWPTGYTVPQLEDKYKEMLPGMLRGSSLESRHHFVQVDVKVTHSRTLFDYMYLHDSHSNPFSFLGSSLKKVLLTADSKGLHLLVQEMKAAGQNSNISIDLTSDPKKVCDIVGWDYDRLVDSNGFETTQEMFQFFASSKYFRPPREKSAEEEAVSLTKKELRKRQREIMRQWFEDFLPTTMNNPSYQRSIPIAEEVREEMFQIFPHARLAYQEKLDKFLPKNRDDRVRGSIRVALPNTNTPGIDNTFRRAAEDGLKQLLVGTTDPEIIARSKTTNYPLPALPNLDPRTLDDGEVLQWVKDHWQEVGQWKMWAAPGDCVATNSV